jgi:hypothetical protein
MRYEVFCKDLRDNKVYRTEIIQGPPGKVAPEIDMDFDASQVEDYIEPKNPEWYVAWLNGTKTDPNFVYWYEVNLERDSNGKIYYFAWLDVRTYEFINKSRPYEFDMTPALAMVGKAPWDPEFFLPDGYYPYVGGYNRLFFDDPSYNGYYLDKDY